MIAVPRGVVSVEFEETTITVPASAWVESAALLRPEFAYLDLLTAWEADGGFILALQVFSLSSRERVRLACQVEAAVDSLTGVYPGVDWHERETAEMFGIDFLGHPNLVPLLLPDAVVAPLRKNA